jgi:quercetin dioxygenase-like cupin family protein
MRSMLPRKPRQATLIHTAVVMLSLLAAGFVGTSSASAQQPPTGNKGLKATKTQTLDLGPEIEGMANRQLRFRMLTIDPGGYIGIHSHKDRPAAVYFLQGTDTVTSADGSAKVFKPGDVTMEGKEATHWHRNDGAEPVIFVTVDILHKK